MASTVMNTKIISRNDTSTNWSNVNPILLKGEIGIEIDTKRIKIGDGIQSWTALSYSNVIPEDLLGLGYGDMLKSTYDTNSNGKVDTADKADKLSTPVKIAGVSFDGSADIVLNKTNVGLGNIDNTSDINKPVSTLQQAAIEAAISDSEDKLGTAAFKDGGISSGNVVVVESNGKINSSLMPSIAITDTFIARTEEEMLELTLAEIGDVCVRTDVQKTFILSANGYNVLSNWIELKSPTDGVESVNGQTGVVNITTTNIEEGNHLYYTEERVNNNFKTQSSVNLVDGGTLLRTTDSLLLNGGNA